MDPDPGSLPLIFQQLLDFLGHFGIALLIIAVLLLLSALASGGEVAMFSLSEPETDEYKQSKSRSGKKVAELLDKPKRLLATILIFNNLVNVALILLSTVIVERMAAKYHWENETVLLIINVALVTFILLFFGEITPKVYASRNRHRIVKALAFPLFYLRAIFSPISWLLINSTNFIDKRVGKKNQGASFEELKHAIELTSDEDSPEEEKEILKGIVNFSSIAVKSIMCSRVDVKSISIDTNINVLIEQVNEFGYSRIPIFEGDLDHIKGILHIKDLLPIIKEGPKSQEWQSMLRSPYFVPESKKIDDLLEELKEKRQHMAIVVDEFGGTSGIVTMEDIIEEIFGEINDEFDEEENIFSKLSENEYVFEGRMLLNDLIKFTEIQEDSFDEIRGDSDSLAGIILEISGIIPQKGDIIEYKNFVFTIESASKSRIKRVKMEIKPHESIEKAKTSTKES